MSKEEILIYNNKLKRLNKRPLSPNKNRNAQAGKGRYYSNSNSKSPVNSKSPARKALLQLTRNVSNEKKQMIQE